jgi:quinol monooxygenase YgiN
MSVIVTVLTKGDPKQVEEYASANADSMQAITESARSHGVIGHRFYGADGQVLVIDEWPDGDSFHAFFQENSDSIGSIMQAAGAQGPPEINVWEKLETHDDVGWGA